MMKSILKGTVFIFAIGLFFSCAESRKKASEKLNEMNEKADQLNNALEEGLKKIDVLDSVISAETEQIKEFDSLIEKSSTKIDSIAKQKMESWKNITN
ncbi:MAG TPA: hypothetical protein VFM82_10590 [Flavobacteriaceae bacterium]|nr:hypothetical protein [Flavobacteriaceae bacterium]